MMKILACVFKVLDIALFWLIAKHKDRLYDVDGMLHSCTSSMMSPSIFLFQC
jgi:hypothetical protein